VLVNKFPQDVAWARNQAVTTQQPVEIDLTGIAGNACTWLTKINGQPDATHSFTQQQFAAYPNMSCSINSPPATGHLVFDSQGFLSDGNGVAAAPTVTIKAAQGQTWILQVLASGSVILNSNTAS
jgi:Tfp pilus assembly protein FimT